MISRRHILVLCFVLLVSLALGQPQNHQSPASKTPPTDKPEYFDEPQFTVAGMTDNSYRGGHGSDTMLDSTEALTKATAALGEIDRNEVNALERVRKYQRAAELNPSEPNLFDWGAELLKHRAADPAIEVFTKGHRLFPRSARMLLGLGAAFYARGSYNQAAHNFFEACDLNPSDPKPYLFLGKVQALEITESEGYFDRLRQFAELQPDNAWANYYYAVALWKRQPNHADATTSVRVRLLLEKAARLDPHLGAAYLELGIISADQKNFPAAISAYRKAIEISPQIEEVHYRLSQAYMLTGQKLQAQKELALYNQLSKKSAEDLERERAELQRFVVVLKSRSSASQNTQAH
jgi:tetratricopeptide (TPR) repeat protein